MNEDKELRQALDDTLDWMADLPEHKFRQVYPEKRIPNRVDFTWEIGGTEYIVKSYFKKSNADDIINKIGRLLEDEVTG